MTITGISKKLGKVIGFVLGTILVLLTAFHFWFVNHAEKLIEDLVESQSNGKLRLEVKKFKFNWFSRRIELQNASFYSTDTITTPVAYRFEVDRLKLKVKAILPIVVEKKFLIDSLHLINPKISVTSLRLSRDSTKKGGSDLSIPQEMGRIYNSIQDALKVLKVDRFQIDNGQFSLINKNNPAPGEQPVTITNIYFYLDNLRVDSTKDISQQKILFSDNVSLQTYNQDIVFPDGRHRLSFGNFRINIRNRLAEFDSCTIVATKGDSTNNSFKVFFDKLLMTNIDFDTLYHSNVIKADSVYCINPRFQLDIDLKEKVGPAIPVRLDEMIQQLTGDLQLKIVTVQNASFDINTMRAGRPSSFTSQKNNFELQGLHIDQTAPKPVVVERFAMAIRNFENFLRDSAYAIQFDSILINNNRISLSNFSYQELQKERQKNRLQMQQFELYGLSWDHLIINRQLKADRVVLYKPTINYNLALRQKKKQENIFEALEDIGTLLQLHNLQIVDGQVNLFFKNDIRIRLENATTFIEGEQLVASRKLQGIQKSVNALTFKKGTFNMRDLTATFTNAQITNGRQLFAAGIQIRKGKEMAIDANNVLLHSMILDDNGKNLSINGVSWSNGTIDISKTTQKKPSGKGPNIFVRDLKGENTGVKAHLSNKSLSLTLQSLNLKEFSIEEGRFNISGINTKGKDLVFNNGPTSIKAGNFLLRDQSVSSLGNISFTKINGPDSTLINIPEMNAVIDIQSILNGKIKGDNWEIIKPIIRITKSKSGVDNDQESKLPNLQLGKIIIRQPDLQLRSEKENESTLINWKGQEDNFLEIEKLDLQPEEKQIKTGGISFIADHFNFGGASGKKLHTEEGRVVAKLRNLALILTEAGSWDWHGTVTDLSARNFFADSLGKQGGKLNIESIRISELSVSAASLLNIREMVKKNSAFQLKEFTGSYNTNKDKLNWNNASYNKNSRQFLVDSVRYEPAVDKDEFVKSHDYQTDYIKANTGTIRISSFNIDKFVQDTLVELGVVSINDAYLYDYRDKRPPREPNIIRLLPAKLLKRIPGHLLMDTLRLNNAHISYAEVNEKTHQVGQIEVTQLNARITRLRNYNLLENDSLYIRATARLQDAIPIRLQLKESYADTLGGFFMTAQMGRSDLKVLNPVLIPMAGARIKSGYMDTMMLRVVGREYLSFGEMKMFYHNLKVELVDKDGKPKSFFSRIVNTTLKNKNTDKTSTIFFVRLRDRSAMNYLVKITLSGVSSSVGFKNNKKQIRRYKREILNRDLPPILFESEWQ